MPVLPFSFDWDLLENVFTFSFHNVPCKLGSKTREHCDISCNSSGFIICDVLRDL